MGPNIEQEAEEAGIWLKISRRERRQTANHTEENKFFLKSH